MAGGAVTPISGRCMPPSSCPSSTCPCPYTQNVQRNAHEGPENWARGVRTTLKTADARPHDLLLCLSFLLLLLLLLLPPPRSESGIASYPSCWGQASVEHFVDTVQHHSHHLTQPKPPRAWGAARADQRVSAQCHRGLLVLSPAGGAGGRSFRHRRPQGLGPGLSPRPSPPGSLLSGCFSRHVGRFGRRRCTVRRPGSGRRGRPTRSSRSGWAS
jgi:hypothetical protein